MNGDQIGLDVLHSPGWLLVSSLGVCVLLLLFPSPRDWFQPSFLPLPPPSLPMSSDEACSCYPIVLVSPLNSIFMFLYSLNLWIPSCLTNVHALHHSPCMVLPTLNSLFLVFWRGAYVSLSKLVLLQVMYMYACTLHMY